MQQDRLDNLNDFSFNVSFRHSFARPINLQLKSTNGKTVAIVEILDFQYDLKPPVAFDTVQLSKEEVIHFLKLLENTPVFSLNSDSTMRGMSSDGGVTYFSAVQGDRKNSFEVEDWVTLERRNK